MKAQAEIFEKGCTLESICKALKSLRIKKQIQESEMHEKIKKIFGINGIPYLHEYSLDKGVRVDFFITGIKIIIEVKKGKVNRKSLIEQLERYAHYATAIVVITPKSVRNLPEIINGTFIKNISLGRNWGVAI